MDYGTMMENLMDRFGEWCNDNGLTYTESQVNRFAIRSEERIEEIMTGGCDMDEAYEMYLEELNDEIRYIMRE